MTFFFDNGNTSYVDISEDCFQPVLLEPAPKSFHRVWSLRPPSRHRICSPCLKPSPPSPPFPWSSGPSAPYLFSNIPPFCDRFFQSSVPITLGCPPRLSHNTLNDQLLSIFPGGILKQYIMSWVRTSQEIYRGNTIVGSLSLSNNNN